jgi:hypothetical protein
MSRLPRGATATVDDAKITKYLLNPAHPIGRSKAQFFGSFGFSSANWMDLKKALVDHPKRNAVTDHIRTPYGEKYVVSCSLVAPDGRNPCIVSVWISEPPHLVVLRFVTAYPGP